MTSPLPPEREGSTRHGRAGEGLSLASKDHAYDRLPTDRSRELRNNPTPAERKLWNVLSNRQLCGVRFNRQVVIRPYICDLVARSAKLIIEIDGGHHGASIGYDDARTAFLKAKDYRVIRFWNNEVMENIEGVVATIIQALENPPSHQSEFGRRPVPRTGPRAPELGRAVADSEGEGLSSSDPDMPSPARLRRVAPSRSGGRGNKA